MHRSKRRAWLALQLPLPWRKHYHIALVSVASKRTLRRRVQSSFECQELTNPVSNGSAINSFSLNAGRLDDRRPFGNFALDQIGQRLRPAPFLVREVAAKIEQALARVLVIKRLVERSTQLVDDRLGRSLGR